MRNLIRTTKKRLTPLLVASVLLTGGIGTSVLFTGGTADAAPCTGANPAGTACTITGTLTLTSGSLTLTAPPAVGWAATISGSDQQLSDPTVGDQTYTVDDATGNALGWHLTVSATAFTSTTPTTATLGTAAAITPTFATNGSLTLMTATTAPTASCTGTSTCTVGTDSTTYPVTITTGNSASAAPVNIYDAHVGSGLGSITVGLPGAAPVGWWINVPSNTLQGSYSSTISLELISGP
jgi:hypothetical protein